MGLNNSVLMYQSAVWDHIDTIKSVMLTLTIFSVVLIFMLVMFIIKPMIWLVEGISLLLVIIKVDNKHGVIMLFTEIPLSIIRSFEYHCKDRLIRIQQEREQQNKEVAMSEISDTNLERVDEQNVPLTKDSLEKENRSSERPVQVNSNIGLSKRYFTLLQISAITAACLIYFVVTYWIEFGNIESILISGAAVVNWSAYRMTQFILTLDDMKTFLSQVIFLNLIN